MLGCDPSRLYLQVINNFRCAADVECYRNEFTYFYKQIKRFTPLSSLLIHNNERLKYWASKIEKVNKEGIMKVLLPIFDSFYRGFDFQRFIRDTDVRSFSNLTIIVSPPGC